MSKILLTLLILASTNTFAAVTKWVDSQGQVHYSDEPPPTDVKAEKLRSTSNIEGTAGANGVSETSPSTAPKSFAEREAELKKAQQAKKEAADKAAQKQAVDDARKADCANAQQNLRTLQEGIRMVEIDAKGERSFMDDQQRQQRITKAQQDISTLCK